MKKHLNKLSKAFDRIGIDIPFLKISGIYDLVIGSEVKILSGKFAGQKGIIKSIDYSNEIVELEIRMFGRIINTKESFSSLEDQVGKEVIYPSTVDEFKSRFHSKGMSLFSADYIQYLHELGNEDLYYYIIYNVIYNEPELFFELGFDKLKFVDSETKSDFIYRLGQSNPTSIYLEKYFEIKFNGKSLREIVCRRLLELLPKDWAICFYKFGGNMFPLLWQSFKNIMLSDPSKHFAELDSIRYIGLDIESVFIKFYFEEFLDKLTNEGFGQMAFVTEYSVFEIEKYIGKLEQIENYIKVNNPKLYEEYQLENDISFMKNQLKEYQSREGLYDIEKNIQSIMSLYDGKNKKDLIFQLRLSKSRCSLFYPKLEYLYDDAIEKLNKEE